MENCVERNGAGRRRGTSSWIVGSILTFITSYHVHVFFSRSGFFERWTVRGSLLHCRAAVTLPRSSPLFSTRQLCALGRSRYACPLALARGLLISFAFFAPRPRSPCRACAPIRTAALRLAAGARESALWGAVFSATRRRWRALACSALSRRRTVVAQSRV